MGLNRFSGLGSQTPREGEIIRLQAAQAAQPALRRRPYRLSTKRKREHLGEDTKTRKKQPGPQDTGKKPEAMTVNQQREESPDMVEEILGWKAPKGETGQQMENTKMQTKEDNQTKKTTLSGNTKEKRRRGRPSRRKEERWSRHRPAPEWTKANQAGRSQESTTEGEGRHANWKREPAATDTQRDCGTDGAWNNRGSEKGMERQPAQQGETGIANEARRRDTH